MQEAFRGFAFFAQATSIADTSQPLQRTLAIWETEVVHNKLC